MKLILIRFIVTLLFAATALGQANTSLRGTVSDQTSGLVQHAVVTLTNTATGMTRKTVTSNQGEYDFQQVPPGPYRVSAEAPSFTAHQSGELELLVNEPATLNIVLNVGAVEQSVTVASEALLNTVDASAGSVISEKQVKELPLEARDVAALYSLQPGVVYLGNRSDINLNLDTRSGAVNGAHSDQSNILLDGVDVNDQSRGYAFTSVLRMTPDAMQEFRVATTNYDAGSGRSSGAQISIVTKSGTNRFHGALYEYNRNTATSANDYFIKLSQLENGEKNQPPKLNRNIFGGAFGGPLRKDRLFFFMNADGRRDNQANSVLRVVPSATLRQGIVQYQYCGTALDSSGNCPGAPKVFSLSPQVLTAMDPLHLGPDPTVLKFLQSYPMPNDASVGDGLNYSGYRFAAPINNSFDTYIARLDYLLNRSGSQALFWRGNLQQDRQGGAPYLPGQTPLQTNVDRSKGFVAGYSAVLTSSLVNTFRWGLTRQSQGVIGNSGQPEIIFRGLNDGNSTSTPNNNVYSHAFTEPVHNLVDDLSWHKGNHSVSFGANIRFIRDASVSQTNSFSVGYTNASWLPSGGIANTGTFMDPPLSGYPAVLPSFANSYDYPLIALLGAVTTGNSIYNYDRNGNLLSQGAPIARHFADDQYEFYAQDTWRIKPNLTVIYGLRYQLASPPWETNGLQVAPNVNMGQWFLTRAQDMYQGIPSSADPTLSFNLAGPANGKAGLYNWDYKDFAPRLSIAWLPSASSGFLKRLLGEQKTSIRAGFGIVYDNIGESLINTFDQMGSYGLSTQIESPLIGLDAAPRLTNLNAVPVGVITPAPPGGFPQTPPSSPGNTAWGLDNSIRTPYSYQLAFSVSRQLSQNLVFEASYAGRLSHRLLAQEDLAMPMDLVDTATGIDYFSAATRFSQLASANTPVSAITPALVGPTAKYWTDIFPGLAIGGMGALQSAYSVMSQFVHNETTGLSSLDVPASAGGICPNGCSKFGPNAFFNPQYSSLYAWRSIGTASYHGLQVGVRRRFAQGVQFDFNYTFSKSIDLQSDGERINGEYPWQWGGEIINAWAYKQLRAVSDFDTTHQLNANWVAELPFGRGKRLGNGASPFVNALIGGWQLSGIFRWTSGFPISAVNGYTWPTNWNLSGDAVPTGPIPSTGVNKNGDGTVNLFSNPTAAIGDFRIAYPGESGARNNLRGDGVFDIDMGLSKRWRMPYAEGHSVQFRWDVFNVTNSVRFDVRALNLNMTNSASFGNYTGLISNPRVMQVALRYEF